MQHLFQIMHILSNGAHQDFNFTQDENLLGKFYSSGDLQRQNIANKTIYAD